MTIANLSEPNSNIWYAFDYIYKQYGVNYATVNDNQEIHVIRSGSLLLLRQAFAVLCFFVAFTHLPILAQTRTTARLQPVITPNRITESIDGSRVQVLPNHLPRWANAENDKGPATG